jgi:hypothetical protein
MSDNMPITPGSGGVVATDEINGAHYQRMKPCIGDDGVAVDVSLNNPMPVRLENVLVALQAAIENMMTPIWINEFGRVRVTVDTGSMSTVTTVTTVTNMAQVGGVDARGMIYDAMQNNWANTVRPRIS